MDDALGARDCGGRKSTVKGSNMHARTSSWKGSADTIERWAEHVTANVRPMVEQLPGNAGAYFLVDRADGRALTLTLWEDETAAIASDATAEQSRESTIAATGVELLDRGRWELAAQP
jgi:heme-degrading monooxygenase HmoA